MGEIYVDEPRGYLPSQIKGQARLYGDVWCHMATDGPIQELHDFARSIGLQRSWFQNHATVPHYDLTPGYRDRAIKAGAEVVRRRELVKRCSLFLRFRLGAR